VELPLEGVVKRSSAQRRPSKLAESLQEASASENRYTEEIGQLGAADEYWRHFLVAKGILTAPVIERGESGMVGGSSMLLILTIGGRILCMATIEYTPARLGGCEILRAAFHKVMNVASFGARLRIGRCTTNV